jgi:hypothetical protein
MSINFSLNFYFRHIFILCHWRAISEHISLRLIFTKFFIHIFTEAIVKGFISDYITKLGDHSPESQRILLPACITVKMMFDEYKLRYSSDEVIGSPRFYQIWRKHFAKLVSFPKVCTCQTLF